MNKKTRQVASSGPKSQTGQDRKNLYTGCLERVSKALDEGYALEAITLLESLIADRLEARLAYINGQRAEKRKFSTLGCLTQELKGTKAGEPKEAVAMYDAVDDWATLRNEAVHEFAKLSEGNSKNWDAKYKTAKKAAKNGKKLFRDLDKVIRKLNKNSSDD